MNSKSKNFIGNQKGMSLASVLVAAAIGLVVISALTSMMTDVFKSQRTVQSKDASRELLPWLGRLLLEDKIDQKRWKERTGLRWLVFTLTSLRFNITE